MKILPLIIVAAATVISAQPSLASSASGKVTFVGTISEVSDQGYHARFRVRLAESTCDADKSPKERWVLVRSGRMDGQFAHNMANFRNAYNTAVTAFLSEYYLQIDGLANCDASKVQEVNLWQSNVGVFK